MSDTCTLFAERRHTLLVPLARRLEEHIKGIFEDYPRIDRITVRAKTVRSFIAKAQRQMDGKPQYNDPLSQIQDQLGARIVTFYKSDADKIAEDIKKYFKHIESQRIVPDSESEFGYEGIHYILFIPEDLHEESGEKSCVIEFFELQIKTLFQHAWSEAEHDLGYKPATPLSPAQKRRLAFTAAQAWGADQVFDDLYRQALIGEAGS